MRKLEVAHVSHTQALLESLLKAPLLVGDLRSSTAFDRNLLGTIEEGHEGAELNFSQKLGHLYEDALSFLLEHSCVELIAKGVQIFNEKRITQGELDYLLKVGERVIHLELAVKFYLIHEEDGKVIFPGPDPRDNWDSKLDRLETHQLGMAQSEYGRKLLLDKYGVADVEVQHLIYGKIFDHLSRRGKRDVKIIPRAVVADTKTYPWIYISEWGDFLESDRARFIPKHLWPLSSRQFDDELLSTLTMVEKSEYVASVKEYPSCQMIWSEAYDEPIFLVPDHWPAYEV